VTRQLAELPWARPDWRERAQAWIDAQLGGLGLTATGAVEEVKLRPWSAVLRAPTSGGDVYFKANLPALANEPRLTRLLARIDPVHVLPVLAEEPGERWMLQSDGGPTMRSRLDGHDDLRRWERMLGLYAELQVRASAHAEELLGAGAPTGGRTSCGGCSSSSWTPSAGCPPRPRGSRATSTPACARSRGGSRRWPQSSTGSGFP
jgi:hypothetical protein